MALFQIAQPFAITQNTVYQLGGEQRNRGVEFNVFGEVHEGVRVLGGVTFMDGVQTKTLNNALNGNGAVGVPDVQLNLGGEWDNPFLPGLTHTGRVIYTSSQFANTANTQSIPDWTRVDIGTRYTFLRDNGKPVTIRANIENVIGRRSRPVSAWRVPRRGLTWCRRRSTFDAGRDRSGLRNPRS